MGDKVRGGKQASDEGTVLGRKAGAPLDRERMNRNEGNPSASEPGTE